MFRCCQIFLKKRISHVFPWNAQQHCDLPTYLDSIRDACVFLVSNFVPPRFSCSLKSTLDAGLEKNGYPLAASVLLNPDLLPTPISTPTPPA